MNPSEPPKAAKLLARNLHRLREERGLTIDDLARLTGIAGRRIEAIEAGSVHAHLDEVSLVALGLGVRIAALFVAE